MPRNLSVSDLPESTGMITTRLIGRIRRAKFHLWQQLVRSHNKRRTW